MMMRVVSWGGNGRLCELKKKKEKDSVMSWKVNDRLWFEKNMRGWWVEKKIIGCVIWKENDRLCDLKKKKIKYDSVMNWKKNARLCGALETKWEL